MIAVLLIAGLSATSIIILCCREHAAESLRILLQSRRRRQLESKRTQLKAALSHEAASIACVEPTTGPGAPHPVRLWRKGFEYLLWIATEIWVRWQDGFRPFDGISAGARFTRHVFEPLYFWFGLNERVVETAGLNQVGLRNASSRSDLCVNGGSFNYAGLYELPPSYERLQREALDKLPYSGPEVQELQHELEKRLAGFFDTDCCFLTSTGFGSNVLGFPGILSKQWMLIMDEKCHNSMFTGSFLSDVGARKRFKHNDMADLENLLEATSGQDLQVMVGVEGIYSMDGTMPPLEQLHQLKQRYHFVLYCDEAHSFLSIGRTGRGCLEAYNERQCAPKLPKDLVDVRSGTLSKAVGAMGGFVCASARFEAGLRRRSADLAGVCEPIPTAAVLQALWALSLPRYLARNIARLRDISEFCHLELSRQGVFVYGQNDTPMLPVHAGSPSQASELSYILRMLGLVCPPISRPAVPIWESRVRIGLSPSFTDADVNTLIGAVVQASGQIGVRKASRCPRRFFISSAVSTTADEQLEGVLALQQIGHLLNSQIAKYDSRGGRKTGCHQHGHLTAAYKALARHGLGAGSSRFILGTFVPHLDAERATAHFFSQPAAITYADAGLGTMSTIAALCRPILGHKRHALLIPAKASPAVEAGIRIAPRNSGTTVVQYNNDEQTLIELIQLGHKKKTFHTIYVPLRFRGGDTPDGGLVALMTRLASARPGAMKAITLLVDCDGDFASDEESDEGSMPMPRTIAGTFQTLGDMARRFGMRLLISGSYRRLGGPSGGFVAGDRGIVEELRYSSRCYMFSTSPLPMHMAIVAAMLRARLEEY